MGIFAPEFTFTVDGSAFSQGVTPNLIYIDLGDTAVTTPLSFYNDSTQLADPEIEFQDNEPAIDNVEIDSPQTLVKWLKNHPRLNITKTAKTTIGDVPTTELVVEVAKGKEYASPGACGQGVGCVVLFVLTDMGFGYYVVPGRPLRVQVLEVGGRTVFTLTEPPKADYEGGIARRRSTARHR